jgi:hypothetical protein
MKMRRQILAALAAFTFLGFPTTGVRAETFILDGSTGADYDSVGDGWFFAGGPSVPPDGTGDAANQALAVGLKSGVLELRAMSEFPLSAVTVTASQITSATVTITIDDVIGTFGPGAEFDGTASSPMAVYHYVADGTVTVGDFSPAGLAQLGIITPGVVTDASLAVSGALPFTVDVTTKLKDALTNGDTAFGVLVGTTDSPTATSIDLCEPGGTCTVGVAGAKFPFITIETVALTPPQLDGDELACQTAIAKSGQKLAGTALKAFSTCFGAILKDVAEDNTLDPATTAKCDAQLDPTNPASKIAKAAAKVTSDVAQKCEGLAPDDVGSPCNPSATTFDQVATCLQNSHLAAAQAQVASQYASACTLANAVDLDSAYPDLCN